MKALLLINEKSGAVQKSGVDTIAAMAREMASSKIDLTIIDGDAPKLIDAAKSHDVVDVIAAAGGDGTQAAIAGALMHKQTALLPLPCGTMNLLCRELNIPLDIKAALRDGFRGEKTTIDVGVVGGRVFLNNVVFGAYADLAEAREELREAETLQDLSFSVVAAADALMNADPVKFRVIADGETFNMETNTIAISNNEISHADGLIPMRSTLSGGKLAAYLADATDARAFATLLADFARGAAEQSDAVRVVTASKCVVGAQGARFSYSIDGDPVESDKDITLEIRTNALTVMRTRADA